MGKGITWDDMETCDESYAMTIHASLNERFHAGDIPELHRQNAMPNGSRNHSLDPLEPIYNVSLNSRRSGVSALSNSNSLYCRFQHS